MERFIKLSLNEFPTIPSRLQSSVWPHVALGDVTINLAGLYHQYYLDSFGVAPPNPDPAHFEHLRFLATTKDFRLLENGIGVHPGIRRHKSNELGQAFCRVFLHDYLGITYFAHVAHVLDKPPQSQLPTVSLQRVQEGDAPDYLCAPAGNKVFLAEAKGRYTSISFANKEFESWRKQFGRVVVKNSNGRKRKIKGYIVATRFGTEIQPRVKSEIFAEDPETVGEEGLDEESTSNLRTQIVGIHYGGIAAKLNQPLLSAALQGGFALPDEIQFPAMIWELQIGPFAGARFVGGYLSPQGSLQVREERGRLTFSPPDPFRLDVGRGTFFGVEVSIFEHLTAMARTGSLFRGRVSEFESVQPFYSAVSIMRDGTMLAPLEFLAPVEQRVF